VPILPENTSQNQKKRPPSTAEALHRIADAIEANTAATVKLTAELHQWHHHDMELRGSFVQLDSMREVPIPVAWARFQAAQAAKPGEVA
jgi:hypothetical protein